MSLRSQDRLRSPQPERRRIVLRAQMQLLKPYKPSETFEVMASPLNDDASCLFNCIMDLMKRLFENMPLCHGLENHELGMSFKSSSLELWYHFGETKTWLHPKPEPAEFLAIRLFSHDPSGRRQPESTFVCRRRPSGALFDSKFDWNRQNDKNWTLPEMNERVVKEVLRHCAFPIHGLLHFPCNSSWSRPATFGFAAHRV